MAEGFGIEPLSPGVPIVYAFQAIMAALIFSGGVVAQPTPDEVRTAARKSLTLLQKSAGEYTMHRQCFSCHHQPFSVLAMTTAKAHGFEVDDKELERQLKLTVDHLAKNRANYKVGKGQGGQAETAGYGLLTLHAGGRKADATTAAVIDYLLLRDRDRDFWQASTTERPPTQTSPLTTTYLALAALKNFGSPTKQKEIEARFEKARRWLLAVKLNDTEDRVFHLRALKLAGAEDKHLIAATEGLVKMQRADGGWAQLDKLESDAYATGAVLVALRQAGGVGAKDHAYRRGIEYLLKTQKDDGSWHIRTRSKPFQTYFESGFPHGKDQFISYLGTGWATIALILSLETASK
jgi:N-acyl-D-amino-acid deacylase